jgi:hypothetical protein
MAVCRTVREFWCINVFLDVWLFVYPYETLNTDKMCFIALARSAVYLLSQVVTAMHGDGLGAGSGGGIAGMLRSAAGLGSHGPTGSGSRTRPPSELAAMQRSLEALQRCAQSDADPVVRFHAMRGLGALEQLLDAQVAELAELGRGGGGGGRGARGIVLPRVQVASRWSSLSMQDEVDGGGNDLDVFRVSLKEKTRIDVLPVGVSKQYLI